MPSFIFDGIPGVDVSPKTARAIVEARIAEDVNTSGASRYSECVRRVAERIAEELKEASAAVDAGGTKAESAVMLAYMTATNNQNAIEDIQRERASA